MKPGVKTTEFWVTLITALVGPLSLVLVAAGVFENTTVAESQLGGIAQALGVLIANLTSAWAAVNYTRARTEVKITDQQE